MFKVDITKMATEAAKKFGVDRKSATRTKNFFALGLVYWLYSRSLDNTKAWIKKKFGDSPVAEANLASLDAGYNFGETSEMFQANYEVKKAAIAPGKYRNISGNEALSLGLIAASKLSDLELFLGSYPITPASDILHYLSQHKALGVKTLQAEDEIAAICAAIGASYGGALAVTTTSGPGMALKAEALGLAIMIEQPLIVVNVQRGGPSTGLPTKTEQSDLMQALFGRNGESPAAVICARTPRGLLPRRHRGRPHRDHLHGAGDFAVRWVRRQRRRALVCAAIGRHVQDSCVLPKRSRGVPAVHA